MMVAGFAVFILASLAWMALTGRKGVARHPERHPPPHQHPRRVAWFPKAEKKMN
jgi:hypothetical protein